MNKRLKIGLIAIPSIILLAVVIYVSDRNATFRDKRYLLNQEAQKIATDFLAKRLIKCGEYDFARLTYPSEYNALRKETNLYQFKLIISYPKESEPRSFFSTKQYDYDWFGDIKITATIFRTYDESKKQWGKWSNETFDVKFFEIPLYKANGQWNASETQLVADKNLTCENPAISSENP